MSLVKRDNRCQIYFITYDWQINILQLLMFVYRQLPKFVRTAFGDIRIQQSILPQQLVRHSIAIPINTAASSVSVLKQVS